MAEMSPVELLRAAAARVRTTAESATRGPWTAHPDGLVWSELIGDPVSGSTEPEDAAWIALMHPGLAEPLADWLDEAARSREAAEIAAALINGNLIGDDGPVDVERLDDTADARRVARVLLGVPDGR